MLHQPSFQWICRVPNIVIKNCPSLTTSERRNCVSTCGSCTFPGKPMYISNEPLPSTAPWSIMECHPFLLKLSCGNSLGTSMGMWLLSMAPMFCRALHFFSKHFLALGVMMWTGCSNFMTTLQNSCIQRQTVEIPTLNR